MKILLISFAFAPSVGGLEINSQILADYFYQKKYEICILTSTSDKGSGFPYQVLRNPNHRTVVNRYQWADVVVQNNPSLRLGWPGFIYSSKTIIVLNGIVYKNLENMTLRDRVKKYLIRTSGGVISVSDDIRQRIFPKAVVIGNPYRDQIFQNFGRQRKPWTFVFVGRLVFEKGADLAIKAMSLLKQDDEFPFTPRLKILGDGPEYSHLKKLAIAENLKEEVEFMGRKEGREVAVIMNKSNYILVPSRNEGFGNVVLEGMACGCLPLAARVGGLPEAVDNAGVLFKTESADSLAECILHLYHHPEMETQLREKIPAHLKNHRSEEVAERYYKYILRKFSKAGV